MNIRTSFAKFAWVTAATGGMLSRIEFLDGQTARRIIFSQRVEDRFPCRGFQLHR